MHKHESNTLQDNNIQMFTSSRHVQMFAGLQDIQIFISGVEVEPDKPTPTGARGAIFLSR
jgi:hypothetical protein